MVWRHIQRTITHWNENSPKKPPQHVKGRSQKFSSRPRRRKLGSRYNCRLATITTPIAFTSTRSNVKRPISFDLDSFVIAVDNCATRSITNDPNDFVETPRKVAVSSIKGISGLIQVLRQGTIKWNICDDEGKTHEMLLPNSFYVPRAPMRLLSPQHWAQSLAVAQKTQDATCITMAKEIQLKWDTFTRTISLDQRTNIGLLTSSPSYYKSNTFIDAHEDNPTPICLRAQVRIHNNPQDNEEELIDTRESLRLMNKVTFAPKVEEHQQLKL